SLRRSYRTTLRLYTGDFSGAKPSTAAATTSQTKSSKKFDPKKSAEFMEQKLPRISEWGSAMTMIGLRSVIRAPEAKMLLLSPIIIIFIFTGIMYNQPSSPAELVRPLMAMGGFAFMLFMTASILGNQFGFDRSGFRALVLCPAPRKDILLGKNLTMAPLGL